MPSISDRYYHAADDEWTFSDCFRSALFDTQNTTSARTHTQRRTHKHTHTHNRAHTHTHTEIIRIDRKSEKGERRRESWNPIDAFLPVFENVCPIPADFHLANSGSGAGWRVFWSYCCLTVHRRMEKQTVMSKQQHQVTWSNKKPINNNNSNNYNNRQRGSSLDVVRKNKNSN